MTYRYHPVQVEAEIGDKVILSNKEYIIIKIDQAFDHVNYHTNIDPTTYKIFYKDVCTLVKKEKRNYSDEEYLRAFE